MTPAKVNKIITALREMIARGRVFNIVRYPKNATVDSSRKKTETFTWLDEISAGGNGLVAYAAKDGDDAPHYALKALSVNEAASEMVTFQDNFARSALEVEFGLMLRKIAKSSRDSARPPPVHGLLGFSDIIKPKKKKRNNRGQKFGLLLQPLLDGSLKALTGQLADGANMPVQVMLDAAVDVTTQLEFFHVFSNYIHSDIKPANIGFSASVADPADPDHQAMGCRRVFLLLDFDGGSYTEEYACPLGRNALGKLTWKRIVPLCDIEAMIASLFNSFAPFHIDNELPVADLGTFAKGIASLPFPLPPNTVQQQGIMRAIALSQLALGHATSLITTGTTFKTERAVQEKRREIGGKFDEPVVLDGYSVEEDGTTPPEIVPVKYKVLKSTYTRMRLAALAMHPGLTNDDGSINERQMIRAVGSVQHCRAAAVTEAWYNMAAPDLGQNVQPLPLAHLI